MKTILQLTGLVLLLTVLSGCSDDNSPNQSPNVLKVGDQNISLDKGYFYYAYESEDSVSNELVFMLIASSVNIAPDQEGGDYSITGQGAAIQIHTGTRPNFQLEANYVCSESWGPGLGEFVAMYSADYNFTEDTGDVILIASGDLTVDKSGNVFELEFDCTDQEGVKVSGYFKGSMTDLGD